MSCMTAEELKRVGEAAHGLAAFLKGGQPGWVFLNRDDPRKVRYAMTPQEYERVKDELAGGNWMELQFCKSSRAPRPDPTRTYNVVISEDGKKSKDLVAGVPDEPDTPWVDAIFFSRSAVEKFIVPYAAGLYGAETAMKMLEAYGEDGEFLVLHFPPTVFAESTDVMPPEGAVTVDQLLARAVEQSPSSGVGM